MLLIVDANIGNKVMRLLDNGGRTVLFRAKIGNHVCDKELVNLATQSKSAIITRDKDFIKLYKDNPVFTVVVLRDGKNFKRSILQHIRSPGCYIIERGCLYSLVE